ncbi:3-dehydroquinate synthase [Anoxynatronum buryatiense]|uniref:3-dehydroquinate synthase n=1 Tax=Anoxynatronum buryatiense TaxID=489973 RepID=A0AA45WYG7_9CLOT|nr:3-dehydroquinate synthase [Anoxynatronum buryatiense]SMP68154.1 3-dehydroquinate synthase [Anoxynatronum buryatiense]
MLETIQVTTGTGSYDIHIGEGCVTSLLNDEMQGFLQQRRWAVITDEKVGACYSQLISHLSTAVVTVITLPAGESSKTMEQAAIVLEALAAAGITREDGLMALGGGVVGDITGFCAAIYMRGISWLQIPTTLLAQVDSSVGGKTGVNLRAGKNLAGSFYPPSGVWIDPLFLKTLPEAEFWSGCSEVVKYGLIEGPSLREWLVFHWEKIAARDPRVMTTLIAKCLQSKAAIVTADEREAGLRKVLNVGHTAGHAIEKLMAYRITHGAALREGMLLELKMARELRWLLPEQYNEMKVLVERLPVLATIPEWMPDELVAAMKGDKKNRHQQISFMLPRGQGNEEIRFIAEGIEEKLMTPEETTALLHRVASSKDI